MQWVLQDFEDTRLLAQALERLGLPWSMHKVVPFVGDLIPEPEVPDTSDVILFGSYTLWRYAARHALAPGVFTLRSFVHEAAWLPFLLNGEGRFMSVSEVPGRLSGETGDWFLRPVDDGKELPGRVLSAAAIVDLARKVLALPAEDLPQGSLRHDTALILAAPMRILTEWRVWVVDDRVVTWSLYKRAGRVEYLPQIDDDALAFAQRVVAANPAYAPAYVVDICRTPDGLHLLETNCINAAGFYAADVEKIVTALETLRRP